MQAKRRRPFGERECLTTARSYHYNSITPDTLTCLGRERRRGGVARTYSEVQTSLCGHGRVIVGLPEIGLAKLLPGTPGEQTAVHLITVIATSGTPAMGFESHNAYAHAHATCACYLHMPLAHAT